MEIKHKPTHPLPWKAAEDHGDPCLQAADGENIALAVPYDSFVDKEAFGYIAHAANAYPRLVAELKRLCTEIPAQLGAPPMRNNLLRELGEDV